MNEAEKMARRLTAETLICSGVALRRTPSKDDIEAAALIREQEAKIKRMAEALRDFEDAAYGRGTEDLRERHADALRDAGVKP